jgi:hypothetical protein
VTDAIPMFCSRTELLESLRLAGASGQPVLELVNEGVLSAAIRIVQRLGESTVASLRATQPAATPTTVSQVRRAAASIAEKTLVRLYLLTVDSSLTREGSSGYLQAWNREGFMRAPSAEERQSLVRSLEALADKHLSIAATSAIAEATPRLRGFASSPDLVRTPFNSIGWGT